MSDTNCPICGDEFVSQDAVRDHTWDTHSSCHHCGDTFNDRHTLYQHWLEVHENILSEETQKRAERAVEDLDRCPICKTRFSDVTAVKTHTWDVHKGCHRCGETFDDKQERYIHDLTTHSSDLSRSERNRIEAAIGDLSFSTRLINQGPVKAVQEINISRRSLIGGSVVGTGAVIGGGLITGVIGFGNGGNSTIESHPSSKGFSNQPIRGSSQTKVEGTIIAFEDPSCPSCARFEQQTYPKIKSQLIDPGKVRFVYRGIPVVQDWADPAILALEATFARNESAFWALKAFYYDSISQITTQNVQELSRRFLADNTKVAADAIIRDIEEESYRSAVNTDMSAAQDAGVSGTPTFFLFKNRSFATKLVGPQGYSVFKNSLGV